MKKNYLSNFKFSIFEKSLFCGFILSVLFSFVGFSGQCDSIKSRILRLHIIANSDLKEDQELKLKVRDRILKDCGEYFDKDTNNIDIARKLIRENIDGINSIARDEILKNGFEYKVNTYLTNTYFGIRNYDKITLPAGKYDALRIVIGEGKGQNWWCVMFPPLCLPAAEKTQEEQVDEVLTPRQVDIVEGGEKYKIRFKIIEIFETFRDWLFSVLFGKESF